MCVLFSRLYAILIPMTAFQPLQEPPRTPRRDRTSPGLYSNHVSPSSRTATLHDLPNSPRAKPRYSTVRELTRKHRTRWLSRDLTAYDPPEDEDGRPQRRRAGSGESPLLSGGWSVVLETFLSDASTYKYCGHVLYFVRRRTMFI